MPPSLQASDWRTLERLSALHVGPGKNRLRAWKTHEPPPGKILVAAIDRVGKHAFHRVRADRIEEFLCRGPGELRSSALLEGRDHLVLTPGIQTNERVVIGLAAIRIQLCKAAPIEILKIDIRAGEGKINVIDHSSIVRARLARCAGHQPLSER